MQHVFIIGSKGIPAKYGGFETFVDNLVTRQKDPQLKYYVACLGDINEEFDYRGATCFRVKVPSLGSAKAVVYDLLSLNRCLSYIRQNQWPNCIIYILASRIGPFLPFYQKSLAALGAQVYLNPDGHEWQRAKWNRLIRGYWKFSEKLMVKYADLVVCDSRAIEKYISQAYVEYQPQTKYIAYGAAVEQNSSNKATSPLANWYRSKGLAANEYYLIVCRFVPENNFEVIIKEFMKSTTKKSLAIITNIEKNKFYQQLEQKTGFSRDHRIKFVGTVYHPELLIQIRQQAFAYLHGHEVGGTNPTLLEALATTEVNLLLDVSFNREVGGAAALYFDKDQKGDLAKLLFQVEGLSKNERQKLGLVAKKRIDEYYSWEAIVAQYEEIFGCVN